MELCLKKIIKNAFEPYIHGGTQTKIKIFHISYPKFFEFLLAMLHIQLNGELMKTASKIFHYGAVMLIENCYINFVFKWTNIFPHPNMIFWHSIRKSEKTQTKATETSFGNSRY